MYYKIVVLFFFITCAAVVEKPMVIVMPSYNNVQWYQKNLDSVFSQTYENWRIIYIDDASTDNTGQLVMDYVKQRNMEHKVTVIVNKHRKGALANHYRAVHMCHDWEIVCQLDGDDWFAHNDVLKYLNEIYQDENIWLTYGSFKRWPTEQMGYSKPVAPEVVEKRLYRETYWTPGQLRTFYAWLFKKIKLEDLLWDHWDTVYGKFYPAACDLALYYPMMEMAGTHFKFIPEILYIHNVATQLNDFKVNRLSQIVASHVLMYKRKYERLEKAPTNVVKAVSPDAKKVDIFIFFDDSTRDVISLIDKCKNNIKSYHTIFAVDITTHTITEYNSILGNIVRTYDSLKTLFLKELHNWWKSSEYVLFIDGRVKTIQQFDAVDYIKIVENTGAYAYFPSLRLVDHMKDDPFTMLDDQFGVWKLCYLEREWMRGSSYFNVLMHKKVIRERLTYLDDNLIKNSLLKDVFAQGMLMIQDSTITRIGICSTTQQII